MLALIRQMLLLFHTAVHTLIVAYAGFQAPLDVIASKAARKVSRGRTWPRS
jgi:hypothetical protein